MRLISRRVSSCVSCGVADLNNRYIANGVADKNNPYITDGVAGIITLQENCWKLRDRIRASCGTMFKTRRGTCLRSCAPRMHESDEIGQERRCLWSTVRCRTRPLLKTQDVYELYTKNELNTHMPFF